MDASKIIELQKGALLMARQTLAEQDKEIQYLRYLVRQKDKEINELRDKDGEPNSAVCNYIKSA